MNAEILWDIENVTPPSNTNYIQSVLDIVSQDGRISYAMAFGDWSKDSIKQVAHELSVNNFELIHIPKAGKNSSDMSLVAHGVELIFKYPHIERFVLISGDGDFRPLLLSQKKYGKETWVICDVKNNASEDLLKMADKFFDYREIINLEETIGIMIKDNKTPSNDSVKINMKLLNNQFNENKLGYNSWLEFVQDAKKATNISYENYCFVINNKEEDTIPVIFNELIKELEKYDDWVLFQVIAQYINFKNSGYKKFKDFALDAEKRGYIQIKNNNLDWYMKNHEQK